MSALTLQICGTGSSVGKSVVVAGLCRIFLQDGFRVCPFKAQNMSLNSFVTEEGLEMGRAQVTQAYACRITPCSDMNPVLLKPTGNIGSQVIVCGKPVGNKTARQYQSKIYKEKLFRKVKESFNRLSKKYDAVVIEGAGSPAEINLKSHDIVNMKMAEYANAPVVLAGDIDKGGVFASLVGTLELLDKKERERVKGFIINKFRGDKLLLKDGIDFLEKKTKKPVLGIVPYFSGVAIPEEDSVILEQNTSAGIKSKEININVIKLPHISNFTDFDAFQHEKGVNLNYLSDASKLNAADVIIIPGTKSTIKDLIWLKQNGLADKILSIFESRLSIVIIGICGGYQMLGKKIYDMNNIESRIKEIDGLGILPIETVLKNQKILSQVKATDLNSGLEVFGYEIHHGQTRNLKPCEPVFKIITRQDKIAKDFEGTINDEQNVWGSYIHGLFDRDGFRNNFLNRLRSKKQLPLSNNHSNINLDTELNKLAGIVRENLDMKSIYRILNKEL